MNSSFFNCDRATHLKIVGTALAAGIVVIAIAFHARTADPKGFTADAKTSEMEVKAGRPAIYSTLSDSTVR